MLQTAFIAIESVFALFFGGCLLYLLALTAAAATGRSKAPRLRISTVESQANDGTVSGEQSCFVLLIPAHNEELTLGAALDGLKRLEYPVSLFRAIVIADNCSDSTAEIAREHGCEALERTNSDLRGKGFALEWALQHLQDEAAKNACAEFDAIVILDADTIVAPNLLRVFDRQLKSGEEAVQARYEVLNADESWRTRLMACALSLAHIVKPLGREQLRLSDGLKGNGMCFARSVVERVPWSGDSITEDIDYTLRLARAGIRIAFAPDTAVWAQMPTSGKQAASQRERWEGGRYRLLFSVAPKALCEGLLKRNLRLADRAVELIIPPFAEMFAGPLLMCGLSWMAGKALGWPFAFRFAEFWAGLLALQAIYLALGLWVARTPLKIAASLVAAPFYILWKFSLYPMMLLKKSSGEWKRTERRQM